MDTCNHCVDRIEVDGGNGTCKVCGAHLCVAGPGCCGLARESEARRRQTAGVEGGGCYRIVNRRGQYLAGLEVPVPFVKSASESSVRFTLWSDAQKIVKRLWSPALQRAAGVKIVWEG